MVKLAADNLPASVNSLFHGYVFSALTGIGLGHKKRLGKKILDFSGPFIDDPVARGKLFNPDNHNNAPELFISLECANNLLGNVKMGLARNIRIKVGAILRARPILTLP